MARPLFSLACIALEEVLIQPGDDIVDIIAKRDLSDIDGIFTAGGDGTHAAAFNGLVQHRLLYLGSENPANLDFIDPIISKLDIPIGILPTGSGNGTSFALNMTHDLQSCVVNVILGNKRWDQLTKAFYQLATFFK